MSCQDPASVTSLVRILPLCVRASVCHNRRGRRDSSILKVQTRALAARQGRARDKKGARKVQERSAPTNLACTPGPGTEASGAGVTAHVDFASVKRASLDWCPEIAALSASSGAAGQMPTALSAEQLRDLKATLEELEDMYSKLDKGKVCAVFLVS